MHTTAIICEFDPLHRGHEYLISEARRAGAECVLCVMSGAFCQRGEPSAFSKLTRARAAIAAGADVVLELPFPYSCASAEFFAFGAVGVIAAVGGVDTLAFGCECADAEALVLAAERTESAQFRAEYDRLAARSPELGAAALFELAYTELYGDGGIFRGSNNILAIEYIKAARRLSLDIEFHAVRRVGAGHGDMSDPSRETIPPVGEGLAPSRETIPPVGEGLAPSRELSTNRTVILERSEGSECDRNITLPSCPAYPHFASASLIREKLRTGDSVTAYLPDSTCDIFLSDTALRAPSTECTSIPSLSNAERAVLAHFRLDPAAAQTAELTGGLGNRLTDAACRAHSYDEFFSLSRTKKYTDARIRRAVVLSMCGVEDADLRAAPAYTTLLGLGERGAAFLAERKKHTAIPIVSNPAMLGSLPESASRAYTLSRRAEGLRSLCTESIGGLEDVLRTPPVIAGKDGR